MAAAVQAIRRHKLEAARINDTFLKYDADGSGAIDKDELMDALADLGMKLTPAQADSVVRKYAAAGSAADELTRDQFLRCVNDLQAMQAAASPRGSSSPTQPSRPNGPLARLIAKLPVWKHHERVLVVYQNKWMQSTPVPEPFASPPLPYTLNT